MSWMAKVDTIAQVAVLLSCSARNRPESSEKISGSGIIELSWQGLHRHLQMKFSNQILDKYSETIDRLYPISVIAGCTTLDLRKLFSKFYLLNDDGPALGVIL
jgi:hypothetical protein